jgi:uncharacterized protein involved in outer membrane biogenesis
LRQLGIGVVLVLLALIIPVVAYWLGGERSLEELRPSIERELTEVLDLRVTLSGPIRIEWAPRLRLSAEDVRIANLPGRPSPSLLTVARLSLDPQILPLFRNMLVIDALEMEDAELRIEPDAQGDWRLRPHLDQLDESADAVPGDPIALSIQQLRISDLEIYFHRPGEEQITTLEVTQLTLASESVGHPLSFEVRGAFEGSAFTIEAGMGSLTEFVEGSETFPIELRARLPNSSIDAKGTLGNPRSLAGMNLAVEAEFTDAALRVWKIALPPLGPYALTGTLIGRDGAIGIDGLSLRSDHGRGLEIEIKGDVHDLVHAQGVDLSLHASAPDANVFRNLTSLILPDVPVKLDLELDDDDGSLGIEGELELAHPEVFELVAQGVFDDLRSRSELDVEVGLEAPNLGAFSGALTQRIAGGLPQLGPVKASGRLVLHGDRLGAEKIDIQIGDPAAIWLNATGSIGDLLGLHDVALDARLGAASARRLAALYQREIPEIGSVAAAFSIRDADGSLGVEDATLQVGDAGGNFQLKLSGGFDDLRKLEAVSLTALLEARDPEILGALGGLELPLAGPVSFRGEVRGSAGQLAVDGRLSARATSLQARLRARLSPGERPTLDLLIESPFVDLADILRPTSEETDGGERTHAAATWWNSDKALPFEVLRGFDANLVVKADRMHGYELFEVQAVELTAELLAGRLNVTHLGADYEAGQVSGKLEIDARPGIPSARLELETFNVDLTRMMSQFQSNPGYAGLLDLSVDLATHGTTGPELRSNLDGFFGAMLRDGAMANRYARAVTFDILHVSIPGFDLEPDAQSVQCLLAMVPIADGVGHFEKLYLKGKKITISGVGDIDLGRGQLDLRLTPEIRDPGLLSVATTVDVSGPIESPTIDPVRRSMVTSALSALIQNATRPLRAVRDTIRPETGQAADPCAVVVHARGRQMTTAEVEPLTLEYESATP